MSQTKVSDPTLLSAVVSTAASPVMTTSLDTVHTNMDSNSVASSPSAITMDTPTSPVTMDYSLATGNAMNIAPAGSPQHASEAGSVLLSNQQPVIATAATLTSVTSPDSSTSSLSPGMSPEPSPVDSLAYGFNIFPTSPQDEVLNFSNYSAAISMATTVTSAAPVTSSYMTSPGPGFQGMYQAVSPQSVQPMTISHSSVVQSQPTSPNSKSGRCFNVFFFRFIHLGLY